MERESEKRTERDGRSGSQNTTNILYHICIRKVLNGDLYSIYLLSFSEKFPMSA